MERIIIATDFSDAAGNAVEYGARLASLFNSEIILVHAFALPLAGYDSITPVTVIGEIQQAALTALDNIREKLIKTAGFDRGITCVAEPGTGVGVISDVADRYSADLVVMGMVGDAGFLKKHLIGSNALDAARNMKLPVLIVPEQAAYKQINKMSLAFDMLPGENSKLFYSARYFAKALGAKLEIVHVQKEAGESWDTIQTENKLEKVMDTVDHTTVQLYSADVGKALEEYFRSHPSDMLIVQPMEHGFFKKHFAGTVTSQLAFATKVPLLAIR